MTGRPRAVLYTRRSCPLCFALGRLAARSARRHRVELVEVEVDADPALAGRYGDRVPVLELPGGRSISGRAAALDVDRAFGEAASFLRALEAPVTPDGRLPPRRLAWLLRVLHLGGHRSGDRTA